MSGAWLKTGGRLLARAACAPVFIMTVAYALRVVLLVFAAHHAKAPVAENFPYGFELGRVARAIAAGEGFSSPLRELESGPTVWFTPIYPYIVAGIFKLWGIYSYTSQITIQIMNCVFSALTILPIYAIARRTFGRGVAVGAAWTWTVFPAGIFYSTIWIWDTALTALVFALIFQATLALRESRSIRAWAGYGALWATGVLINPSLLSTLPFLFGWLLWEARKQHSIPVRPALTAMLLFVLALAPWTVRNYLVFGKMIVLRSNFGLELWLGNSEHVPDTWAPWMHPNDNPEEARKFQSMGEIAYMEEKQREALQYMRNHPQVTVERFFRRFVYTWLSIADNPVDAWKVISASARLLLISNCVLGLSSLLGALFAIRGRLPEAAPFAWVLLVFPLIFCLTHASSRYRLPMDPILIILAVQGLFGVISLLRNGWARRGSAAEPVASV